jgi:hypothetical protein
VRRSGVERELAALTDLGFDAAELDLRDYFGQEQRLRGDLAGVALAWLRGGNVFMLRFALFRSAGTLCSAICLPQTRSGIPLRRPRPLPAEGIGLAFPIRFRA